MMEEAEGHPEVLHSEEPNIASQLQEAAQTNVLPGNGSSPVKPLSPQVSPMQAPVPLPSFIASTSPSSPSATLPTTTTVVSFPLSKTPSMPSSPQVPQPSSSKDNSGTSVTPPSPGSLVTTLPTTITTQSPPGPIQTPQEASSSIPVSPQEDDGQQGSAGSGGILGWGRGIMNKVVEKTKSSVESVITTLDPGMKELILSGGDVDVVVTSIKENKVSPVREAFQQVFGKATITGQASEGNTAAQPVGFTAGLKGAEERIQNLRHSGSIHEKQPVISVEGFIAELLPDRWYEMSCLVLEDPGNNIEIQLFTQATFVPAAIIQRMQDGTAADYPMRWSGLGVTVGQAVEETFPNVSRTNWQEALTGVKRKDSLFLAVKSLAEMYRQRLPNVSS